jgi:hypothetical protein
MWVKQCHKPPIWEWFIPPLYGDLGMVYKCSTHVTVPQNTPSPVMSVWGHVLIGDRSGQHGKRKEAIP